MATKKTTGKKLADMMYGNPEGAAFGITPMIGKRREDRQDREAAKSFPVDLARGVVAGAAGMPGDIESLIRMLPGLDERTFLPTSEDVLKRIPFGTDTPAGQFASGLGTLAGGSANIGAAPRMVKQGALAAGRAGERMAERVVPQIMERGGAGADVLSGLAQGSQSRIFIGPKAKTFHKGKADMAVALEEAGRTPQEIWLATGTFRGADGILRQEIDDRAAKLILPDEQQDRVAALKGRVGEMKESIKPIPQKDLFPKALTEAKKGVRSSIDALKEEISGRSKNARTQGIDAQYAFEHPELYEAYPELKGLNITMGGREGTAQGASGALSVLPKSDKYPGHMEMDMYNRGLMSKNPTSVALHEMQHAVQTLEGMGPGGSPTFAFQNPEAHEILKKLREETYKPSTFEQFQRVNKFPEDEAQAAYEQYLKERKANPITSDKVERAMQETAAMEYYKRLLGEAEARAVQDRQMMTPSQRMETPPPASYDVPQEDLIVKPPREYADGGRVHFSDNPDVMQLELAGGGLVKGLKAAAKAVKGTQEDALLLAQQRAALPVEKGGLGLPAKNTPQQRAKAMGINTDAYHGTKQDITGAFRPGYDDNLAFVTKSPDFANKWIGKGKLQQRSGEKAQQEVKSAEDAYREMKSRNMNYDNALNDLKGEEFDAEYDRRSALARMEAEAEFGSPGYPDKIHSTVYPLRVEANRTFNPETDMDVMAEFFKKNEIPPKLQDLYASGNYMMYETKPVVEFLKSKGYDSMRLRESTGDDYPTIAVFNPETTRSRFAAFDPFRRDAATAAAMGVLAPDLLAEEAPDQDKAEGGAVHMATGGLAKAAKALKAAKTQVPIKFPVARGPSVDEIRAMAERMAPQVTGEFVRAAPTKSKPNPSENVVGKSRQQFDREKNLQIGYQNIKPPVTPSEFDYAKHKDELLIGASGDVTPGNRMLVSIDNQPLSEPVHLQAGPEWGLYNPSAWAATDEMAKTWMKRADMAADEYNAKPHLHYHKMTPDANWYAMHHLHSLLGHMRPEELMIKNPELYAKMVDEIRTKDVGFGKHPEFVGFEDPLILSIHTQVDPNLRRHLGKILGQPTFSERYGLRSGQDVMAATSLPELRDLEVGSSGYAVVPLDTKAPLQHFAADSQTYDTGFPMAGPVERSKYPIPYQLVYRDTLDWMEKNPSEGKSSEFGRMSMIVPKQQIDDELIDAIGEYQLRMKALTGKKAGGAVRKAEGGEITADDLILEERKL